MKTIIISGASKGIGYELALLFSKAHRVIAIARNGELLDELSGQSSSIISWKQDIVTITKSTFDSFLSKNKIDSVDVLINNAGVLVNKPLLDLTYDDYQKSFDVNFYGALNLIQCVVPYMKNVKKPHIVNISSVGGVNGTVKFSGLSVYSSSKGALTILSECLSEELKDEGISVNCLALGAVQTEMLSSAFPGYEAPLSSAEMSTYIYNFSLTAQNYMNGQVLKVSLSTP